MLMTSPWRFMNIQWVWIAFSFCLLSFGSDWVWSEYIVIMSYDLRIFFELSGMPDTWRIVMGLRDVHWLWNEGKICLWDILAKLEAKCRNHYALFWVRDEMCQKWSIEILWVCEWFLQSFWREVWRLISRSRSYKELETKCWSWRFYELYPLR